MLHFRGLWVGSGKISSKLKRFLRIQLGLSIRLLMDLPRKLSTIYARGHQTPANSDLSLRRRLPRVLVVDDNPNTMSLMQDLLSSRGYDVVAFPDAAQAEIEILRHPPDLVLSDVVMPGKSGYELCRELKENPATRLIPFVLITGLSEREDRVRGIEAGADDFLSKPIFPEELFARVKSLIKLKEFTDELETAESILCTLGLSVESRDPYTEGHCERLAENASNLGRYLRLEEDEITALRRGGYLHDLGKIAVLARVLQVVDVYDALRTARPYKPALSHEQAAITMRDEGRAGLWDEELVTEFFSMLEKQRQVA